MRKTTAAKIAPGTGQRSESKPMPIAISKFRFRVPIGSIEKAVEFIRTYGRIVR